MKTKATHYQLYVTFNSYPHPVIANNEEFSVIEFLTITVQRQPFQILYKYFTEFCNLCWLFFFKRKKIQMSEKSVLNYYTPLVSVSLLSIVIVSLFSHFLF